MSYKNDYALIPNHENTTEWDAYWKQIRIEYQQSIEEGLDIEQYKDLFEAVKNLPNNEHKEALANVLFDIVKSAEIKEGYQYNEPSDLEGIKALRKPYEFKMTKPADEAALKEKIAGAWYGRICGCLLGKTVEGMKSNELVPFLKESGNWPMHRYIYSTDVTDEVAALSLIHI